MSLRAAAGYAPQDQAQGCFSASGESTGFVGSPRRCGQAGHGLSGAHASTVTNVRCSASFAPSNPGTASGNTGGNNKVNNKGDNGNGGGGNGDLFPEGF